MERESPVFSTTVVITSDLDFLYLVHRQLVFSFLHVYPTQLCVPRVNRSDAFVALIGAYLKQRRASFSCGWPNGPLHSTGFVFYFPIGWTARVSSNSWRHCPLPFFFSFRIDGTRCLSNRNSEVKKKTVFCRETRYRILDLFVRICVVHA